MNADKWTPTDGMIFEKNAEFAIRNTNNILITAGPGAGKTELLAQKANFLFTTRRCAAPYRILALSFKNDSASNLKKRVYTRMSSKYVGRFDSYTFDAFFKMILDHFILSLPHVIRPERVYTIDNNKLIKDALRKLHKPYSSSKEFSFYLQSLEYIDLNDEDSAIRPLWNYLLKKSILTYGMIRALAKWILNNRPKIKLAIQKTYAYVFLDEFQDTTSIQYEITKILFMNTSTKITAVGDLRQRIMLWAGAKKDVFPKYLEDFEAEEISLTANYRSASNLIDLQTALFPLIDGNQPVVGIPTKVSDDQLGKVSLLHTNSIEEEAKAIAKLIKSRINEGVEENDICILVRARASEYSECVIKELNKQGIGARVEDRYQEILNEPVINIVLSMLVLSFDDSSPLFWTDLVDEFRLLRGINEDDSIAIGNLTQSLEQEFDKIRDESSHCWDEQLLTEMLLSMIDFINIERVIAKYQRYYSQRVIKELIKDFSAFLYAELNKSFYDWEQALASLQGQGTVKIMTIHKSKGLEFNTIVLLGLEDDAFFSFKNKPEEEMATLFVAVSRAKEEIIFTYCDFRPYKIDGKHHGSQSINDLAPIYEILNNFPGLILI